MTQMVEEECIAIGNSQRLPARWHADRDQFMALCVTCMGRDEQCKRALLINCAVLWRFSTRVVIVLVTFGDDRALHAWLREHLAFPLRRGLLVVFSGGDVGTGVASPLREGPGRLQYWHASVAKNTAHKAAISLAHLFLSWDQQQRLVLVNLDCDNVVTPTYIGRITSIFKQALPLTLARAHVSGNVAVTGRLAYLAADFWGIGGYDADLLPSGYQDEDLRIRFKYLRSPERARLLLQEQEDRAGWLQHTFGQALPPLGEEHTLEAWMSVGTAFANAPDPKVDRNQAKTANVDPSILRRYPRWGQMDNANRRMKAARLEAGDFYANINDRGDAWVVPILPEQLRTLPEEGQALPPSRPSQAPSPAARPRPSVAQALPATKAGPQPAQAASSSAAPRFLETAPKKRPQQPEHSPPRTVRLRSAPRQPRPWTVNIKFFTCGLQKLADLVNPSSASGPGLTQNIHTADAHLEHGSTKDTSRSHFSAAHPHQLSLTLPSSPTRAQCFPHARPCGYPGSGCAT